MTKSRVVELRLHNHGVDSRGFAKPEEAVKWMGAIQAQSHSQALWAISLRTQSATMADVEQAIIEGKIVRTWPMRGTIHFVPSEDAKWMLRLSAERMLTKSRRRLEQLELNHDILKRCHQLFYEELSGHQPIPRLEIVQLLEDAGISTKNQRGYHILWHAAQSGVICMGPMQKNNKLLYCWMSGYLIPKS